MSPYSRLSLLVFAAFLVVGSSRGSAKRYQSTCETIPAEIHITKGVNCLS